MPARQSSHCVAMSASARIDISLARATARIGIGAENDLIMPMDCEQFLFVFTTPRQTECQESDAISRVARIRHVTKRCSFCASIEPFPVCRATGQIVDIASSDAIVVSTRAFSHSPRLVTEPPFFSIHGFTNPRVKAMKWI